VLKWDGATQCLQCTARNHLAAAASKMKADKQVASLVADETAINRVAYCAHKDGGSDFVIA